MIRAHIFIDSPKSAQNFVSHLSRDGGNDIYKIESADKQFVVDAKSMMGVIYAESEFPKSMYLVNATNDGHFPACVNEYRVLANLEQE